MTSPGLYSGDGLVRPVNAPQGQQVLPGVQPGISGGVVLASFVIIFGTGSGGTGPGMFVYSGTPGPGNPPIYSISNATSDPYGNAIAPGIWAGQFGGTQAGLEFASGFAQLLFPVAGTSPTLVGGMSGNASGGGAQVQIFSALDVAPNNDRVGIILADHISVGSSSAYFLTYTDTLGHVNSHAVGGAAGLGLSSISQLSGVLPGTGTSSSNQAQAETWHQATLVNTWAGSSGVTGLFYRLLPWGTDGTVEVIADIINTTATGNSVCFTLPSGYRPTQSQNHPAAWNDPLINNSPSIPWVNVSTGGALQVTGIEVANKEIFFHIFIPLNISVPAAPSFTPVGTIIQSAASTFSLTPANVGDLILMEVISSSSAPATGISSTNATWTQVGTTVSGVTNSGLRGAVFAGKVTSTSTATATISFTGSPATIRAGGQEYTSSSGNWTFDTQATLDSAGTNTMPSITTVANELYFIFELDNSSSTPGSTPGFTYQNDSHGNGLVYDAVCGAGAQAPTWGSSTCAFGVAVSMKPM